MASFNDAGGDNMMRDLDQVSKTRIAGSSGLSTTSARQNRSSIRSRSPHPAASTPTNNDEDFQPSIRPEDQQLNDRKSDIEQDPFLPVTDGFSATDDLLDTAHSSFSADGQSPKPKPQDHLGSAMPWTDRWEKSKGLLMVVLAMFFSSIMGAIARLMQTGPDPMHTFQILFARQSVTAALSMLYMWWQKTPDAPLGQRDVRPLLLARGVGGFFGVFGLYYSVQYLPLAEAIVITFLAPCLANAVCAFLLKQPFTRREQIAGMISLFGVVLIARPFGFMNAGEASMPDAWPSTNSTMVDQAAAPITHAPEATSHQRLMAILASLLGVCGAACAYTTIRAIGKRAHPLISVNYFSVWCTIVALVAMIFVPGIEFRLPANSREWILLLSLGVTGVTMQYLLTAGLARAKGSSGTNATYTQMIFVLLIDYAIWGTVLTWASWLGAVMILASQIWGAMARGEAQKDAAVVNTNGVGRSDEEIGLIEYDHNEAVVESDSVHDIDGDGERVLRAE